MVHTRQFELRTNRIHNRQATWTLGGHPQRQPLPASWQSLWRRGTPPRKIGSKEPVATLDSRIKVRRALSVEPETMAGLLRLVTDRRYSRSLQDRLSGSSIALLSPKLSAHLIEHLAEIPANSGHMRMLAESLSSPRYYANTEAVQEDAVQTALKVFGVSPDGASQVELAAGSTTALARVGLLEDAVVEHDARYVPGYDFVSSNVTGRAVFVRGHENLEV